MKRVLACIAVLAVLQIGSEARAFDRVLDTDFAWNESRSAMGGETVLCRSTVTTPEAGEGVFYCRLSRGLSFGEVTKVEREGEPVCASYYTVVTTRTEDAAFVLHVSPVAASPGDELTIEYTLLLNEIADEMNTFSLAPAEESAVPGIIRCFSLTAGRAVIGQESGEQRPISGACLCLSRDPEGHDRIAFCRQDDDCFLACVAEDCTHSHQTVLQTPLKGSVELCGLSAGEYYLCETRPAVGQRERAEILALTITPQGEVFVNGELSPDASAVLVSYEIEPAEEQKLSLTEVYQQGTRYLAMALLVLFASRRYYI